MPNESHDPVLSRFTELEQAILVWLYRWKYAPPLQKRVWASSLGFWSGEHWLARTADIVPYGVLLSLLASKGSHPHCDFLRPTLRLLCDLDLVVETPGPRDPEENNEVDENEDEIGPDWSCIIGEWRLPNGEVVCITPFSDQVDDAISRGIRPIPMGSYEDWYFLSSTGVPIAHDLYVAHENGRAQIRPKETGADHLQTPTSAMEIAGAAIEQRIEESRGMLEEAAVNQPVPFVPTPFQSQILDALDGKALRSDRLGDKMKDKRRLYKPGGIKELKERGLVALHPRLGYYRPDAPPPQLAPDVAPKMAPDGH